MHDVAPERRATERKDRAFRCTERVGRTESSLFTCSFRLFCAFVLYSCKGHLSPTFPSSSCPCSFRASLGESSSSFPSLTSPPHPYTPNRFRFLSRNSHSIYNLPCGDLCGDPVPTFSVPEEEYLGCFKDVEGDRLFTYTNESMTDMKASVRDSSFFPTFCVPWGGAGLDRLCTIEAYTCRCT